MGIYANGDIYGIKIYTNNDDDIITLFTKKYDNIMNNKQIKEAYLFYKELSNKDNISFQIYTECFTTHDINNKKTFMNWYPMSFTDFLEKFSN
jgi:hypothetical protein